MVSFLGDAGHERALFGDAEHADRPGDAQLGPGGAHQVRDAHHHPRPPARHLRPGSSADVPRQI